MFDDENNTLDRELGIDSKWDVHNNIDDDDEFIDDVDDYYDDNGTITEEEGTTTTMNNNLHDTYTQTARTILQNNNDHHHRRNNNDDNSNISVMEMLRNFNPDRPPTSGNLEELQLWLECFAQRESVVRHQLLVEKARDRKAFDAMSVMQQHVVQWFQSLRDAIEIRQKEYLSQLDRRRARKRYGPFLCSLHPEKMAVIVSQEAITQTLMNSGKHGPDGVALLKMAKAIGAAVETEVVSQRRIKERYYTATSSLVSPSTDDNHENDDGSEPNYKDGNDGMTDADDEQLEFFMDKWTFSPSHLKLFWDDMKRRGMTKSKRSVEYAMKRARQAMNSDETWTDDDRTHLGAALLSILVDNATIFDNGKEVPAFRIEKRWSDKYDKVKSTSYITLHDKIVKIFLADEYISWAANTTRHMPMIVPPTDWTGPKKGGYRWLEVGLMRTHGSNVQREALLHADLSSVCDGLNILGKTAWRINKKILEVGEYCWNNNIPIGDIPSRDDYDLPPEPPRPSFDIKKDTESGEDPEFAAKMASLQTYRDAMSKRQRIQQKNMVCYVRRD